LWESSDLAAQQGKLDQSIARRADFLLRIKERENVMHQLSELHARADRPWQENEQEEERQIHGLSHATTELSGLRNPASDAQK
jgi:hypothetical protein